MRLPLSILVINITFSLAYAQGWIQTDTLPPAARYDDIYFISNDIGYTVNTAGEIYKTINGGQSWYDVFESNHFLRSIEFINDSIGLAGSLDGLLLRTIDGGETWYSIEDSISGPFGGVCGFSHVGNYVYGVGVYNGPSRFITSRDGGKTWANLDLSQYANGLVDVHFEDTLTGFIGGTRGLLGGVILKTTDGGDNWEQVFISPPGVHFVWKLFFVNLQVGYASIESVDGVFRIAKTTDGGDTWQLITGPSGLFDIQGIGFDTPSHGWASPREESLFETYDGGMTWELTKNLKNINRFFQVPGGRLYASGSQVYYYDGFSSTNEFIEPTHHHSLFAFPVPFSDKLTILATIDERTDARIGILSQDGNKNMTIYDGKLNSGAHTFYLAPKDLVEFSGTLFIYLLTDHGFLSHKVIRSQ
jgi:photosystem II stability/assembly factor-like uncharacterized protein